MTMAYDIVNEPPTSRSIREKNRECLTLIWFDPNMGISDDANATMAELRSINDFVQFQTDFDTCENSIEKINQEKIILICSGSSASKLLTRVVNFVQIDSIFIFCMKKSQYKYLLNQYPKVRGIHTDLESLSDAIRQQIRSIEQQMDVFCFYDDQQRSTKDLSKDSPGFLWFQLFKYVILRLPRNAQSKQQMIDECREYYRGNVKEMNLINLFEREYREEDAIRWYSKESFVYKLVNKALRSEDIDQLYRYRFFIGDLSANLAREHRKILKTNEKKLLVYRGAKLNRREYRRLKKSEGNLISMNGFLSTSRSRELALGFALEGNSIDEMISVLYEIECDVEKLGESVVFADLSSMSEYSDEEEILFDLSVSFRIKEITRDETIRIIRLNASNEEKTILKNYLDDASRQTEQTSPAIVFGKFMCTLGQFDKALNYFQQLRNDSNSEDHAWIEYHLGRCFYFQDNFKKAKEHYDRSYSLMIKAQPSRIKDSAQVLNSLGVLQDRRRRFDKAKEYYQRVLNILEEYSHSDDPDIARTLDNLGLIYFSQSQYDQALIYHTRALTLRESIYPTGHADIALSLNNIGMIFHNQNKYSDALRCHQQAFELQEKFYPSDHIDTSHTLSCIGNVFLSQKDFRRALKYYKKALKIEEMHNSSGNSQMVDLLSNIAMIYEGQGDITAARNIYHQALQILRKSSTFHIDRQQKLMEKIEELNEYV